MSQVDSLKRVRWFLTVLSFSVWWGGLTLYSLVVVPVGTDIFGAVEQGFVTQRVTNGINILTAAWLAVSFGTSRRNWPSAVLWAIQAVTLGLLIVLHRRLDAMLDPSGLSITGDGFYDVHRIYLGLTAVQWTGGAALLWSITGSDRLASQEQAGKQVRGTTTDGESG